MMLSLDLFKVLLIHSPIVRFIFFSYCPYTVLKS